MAVDLKRHDAPSKLPKLPKNARVQKRPLHRPAIPSAYTSPSQTKVVYVSTKTPFMSAVKRVEKLLRLADKRSVQSATAQVRNNNPRKRGREDDKAGEISSIAQALHDRQNKEEVVVKGTGKAIAKALEIGTWFQQRAQYSVRLRTDTTESIDDIEVDVVTSDEAADAEDLAKLASDDEMNQGTTGTPVPAAEQSTLTWFELPEQRDETRIRSLSVIEVYISSR